MKTEIPQSPTALVKVLFFIILGIALFLRIYQYYFLDRSLWDDEAHLALNFVYYGYKDLARPLANFQSAPILFLYTIETFSHIFGLGEKSLRFFPFIVSLCVIPLFYHLIYSLTKNYLTALLGFLMLAVNMFIIYYSSELKPYTIELSVYILLVYLEFSDNSFVKRRRNLLLILAGTFALLTATMSMVVLFCLGVCKAWRWLKKETTFKSDLPVLASWAAVFLINFFLFVYKHPYAAGMRSIWGMGFFPTNVFSAEFLQVLKDKINETIFYNMLYVGEDFGFRYVLLFIFIIGTISIIRSKNYYLLFLTWLPIIIHLVLSMLQLYPFYYRMVLYLLPPFIIIIAVGVTSITTFLKEKLTIIPAGIFLAYAIYCLINPSVRNFPFDAKEVKPSLAIINEKYPNSKIFITTPSTLYEYYYRTGRVKNGNYEGVRWNITPEEYKKATAKQHTPYILFHSSIPDIDGYKPVMDDLKKKNMVVREYDYKTYTITEINPQVADQVKKLGD